MNSSTSPFNPYRLSATASREQDRAGRGSESSSDTARGI
jgi:hypothetical protein